MKKLVISLWLLSGLALWDQGAALQARDVFANSLGMEFALIPAGSFTMGVEAEEDEAGDAAPAHMVTVSRPFYLGTHEVTQEQWEAVMESNPSRFKGRDHPVEQVSWKDVQEFIKKLNEREGGKKYRLPTEAEWEYAARAGTRGAYFFGDDEADLDRYAWHGQNSEGRTSPVGRKRPNPWGLYDIYGNVWEWVQDRYGAEYYAKRSRLDPPGPSRGSYRVLRGGGWSNDARHCRSAFRYYYTPGGRFVCVGFRLAFSPDQF